MKVDPILATRIIYLSEKILASTHTEIYLLSEELDTSSTLFGMTSDEILSVIDILESKDIAEREIQNKEVEPGNIWVEYEDLRFNRKGVKKYIESLKQNIRVLPVISRDTLVEITKQIETIFSKDKWLKVVALGYSTEDFYEYVSLRKYLLIDFLFQISYSKEVSIYDFLINFLNPIYYDIGSAVTPEKLYFFINNTLPDKKQSEWKKKVLKSKYNLNLQEFNEGSASKTVTGDNFYLVKKGDVFHYNGKYIDLSSRSYCYKVLSSLYNLLPEGGVIKYKDLTNKAKEYIPMIKTKRQSDINKFLQKNLTEKNYGIQRHLKNEEEGSGRPLIKVKRGHGFEFNNKKE